MDKYEYKYNKYKHKYLILKKGGVYNDFLNKLDEIVDNINKNIYRKNTYILKYNNKNNFKITTINEFNFECNEKFFFLEKDKIIDFSYETNKHPYGLYLCINNLIKNISNIEDKEKILYTYLKTSYDNNFLNYDEIFYITDNKNILILSEKKYKLNEIHKKYITDIIINLKHEGIFYLNMIYLIKNYNNFIYLYNIIFDYIDYIKNIITNIMEDYLNKQFNTDIISSIDNFKKFFSNNF